MLCDFSDGLTPLFVCSSSPFGANTHSYRQRWPVCRSFKVASVNIKTDSRWCWFDFLLRFMLRFDFGRELLFGASIGLYRIYEKHRFNRNR